MVDLRRSPQTNERDSAPPTDGRAGRDEPVSVIRLTTDSAMRIHLRRELNAHLAELGYTDARPLRNGPITPEIVRMNPVRGRIVYGETVLGSDLRRRTCHERLLSFSQRRTRHRSSILFFIGVAEVHQEELERLLEELEIRSAVGGGHVHIVPISAPQKNRPRPKRRGGCS